MCTCAYGTYSVHVCVHHELCSLVPSHISVPLTVNVQVNLRPVRIATEPV